MELGNLWTVIVDAGLRSAVLCAGGLLVAGGLMKRSSAARRHVVYAGVLVACLLLPMLSLLLPQWRVLPQWPVPAEPTMAPFVMPQPLPPAEAEQLAYEPAVVDTNVLPATPVHPIAPPAWYTRLTWQQWFTLAWLAGAAALLLPVAIGQLAIVRLRRGAQSFQGALVSHRCRMPMACGLLRPTIILPDDARTWPAGRREAVIRHEAEHLRRHDCLWQLLGQLARALYWFNPLTWLVYHRMLCEAERACDDAVLVDGSKASDYAEHLLAVATTGRSDLLLASGGVAMARAASLEGRLLSILDAARSRHRATIRLTVLCALLVLAAAVPLAMLRAQAPKADAPQLAEPESVVLNDDEWLIKASDADGQGLILFSMKTGRALKPPIPLKLKDALPAVVEFTPDLWEWIRENEMDVLLQFRAKDLRWTNLQMQEDFVAQVNDWSQVTDENIKAVFAAKDAQHLVRDDFPASWAGGDYRGEHYSYCKAFRTRDDAMGVYQFKAVDRPVKAVMIRHRFASAAPPARATKPATGSAAVPATPAHGPPSVRLSNGVTVELVGIAECPSKGKQWWTPGGQALASPPYAQEPDRIALDGKEEPEREGVQRQFAFRLSGPGSADASLTCLFPYTRVWTPARVSDRADQRIWSVVGVFWRMSEAEVHVSVAAGPWTTILTTDGRSFAKRDLAGGIAEFSEASESQGVLTIHLTHTLPSRESRVVAVDDSGEEHIAEFSRFPLMLPVTGPAQVRGLPLSRIRQWRLDQREYVSAKFEHVLLSSVSAQAAAAGMPTTRRAAHFLPIQEAALSNPRTNRDAALNLDTGKLMSLPAGAYEKGYSAWLDASDASILAVTDSNRQIMAAIVGNRTVLHKVDPADWDRLSPDQVLKIASEHPYNPESAYALSIFPSLPQTAVFQTPNGTIGILQIIEANGLRHKETPFELAEGKYPMTLVLRYRRVATITADGKRIPPTIMTVERDVIQQMPVPGIADNAIADVQRAQSATPPDSLSLSTRPASIPGVSVAPSSDLAFWVPVEFHKREPSVTQEEANRLIDRCTRLGPASLTPADDKLWKEIPDAIASETPGLIYATYSGHRFVLVSNLPRHRMLNADGPGWRLTDVHRATTELNTPAVAFSFDDAGAKAFGEFTQQHLKQKIIATLADKVVTVATVQSRIERSGILTSAATTDAVADEIIRTLRAQIAHISQAEVGADPALATQPAGPHGMQGPLDR